MYEMEGALLDLPIQAGQLPGSTGSGGPTAGASHPRPVPVSRFLLRPRVLPWGGVRFPTWKYFYSLSRVWRKRPGEATEIFSAVHRTTVVIHA